MIQFLVTDRQLRVQGDPLDGWTSVDATRKFNEPGSGSVTFPARPEILAQLQPGNRLVMIRDGVVWMAGPMEIPTDYAWDLSENAGPGTITANFSDDLATAAGYITWPAPASAWTAQQGNTWWEATANAETTIRNLINLNCGPGARSDRRIPGLILAPATGVGTATATRTRFEPLLEVCRRAALGGGGLGFRVDQTGTQLVFSVYAPRDLTRTARFSIGLGNLRSLQAKVSAPTATHALVAGTETEGVTTRTFVQRADTTAVASWWRVEQYVDGSAETDADGALTADGDALLAEQAAPVELATVTVDTPQLRAGRDYDLGDKVTVALPTGLEVADLVRSIHLQATPDSGEYVAAVIGSPEATTDPQTVRVLRTLTRRLGRLESR
ncbi:siphovirus ReqiPepy6 Gp37-like family protein [Streptomyces sp. NRRL F-5630]|uniref:siphovirus ReqiPepy6 Gp37-like family protein n=1 Tax=Streptomyces sp. NRRL F-5630 TaxID=1463864 RepID=UPI003D760AE6